MKKLTLLSLLILSTTSSAKELHNYAEIKSAAINGKNIHIMVDFSQCTSEHPAKFTNIGVFTPNAIQILNKYMATSLTHFTLNNPGFQDKPVYEFVRYTITDQNEVILTAQVLDAIDYHPLSGKMIFHCAIDSAAKFYS